MSARGLEALGGDDTFPKLLVRNQRTIADGVAMREKEFGIWQSYTLARVPRPRAGLLARPRRARGEAGRQGRHHRRQPAGVGLERDRGAGGGRRVGRPLPGLEPHRGRVRHRPLRRVDHRRGGPGAGRQDPRHARQAPEGPPRRSTRTRAGSGSTSTRRCCRSRRSRRRAARSRRSSRPCSRRTCAGPRPRTWRSSATRPARPGTRRERCSPSGTSSRCRCRSTRWTRSGPTTSS